ncbi:hypothetical protein [Actinomycetospora callitridis]|uniref:hypothetical protein n=1 Tax=Actinomycetospora callitridis TaxID=913944 RepID=UPI00236723F6|nr:hypothetical protein [Actinomycetospora callitridis]MDD7921918.1 hypothetical protein [Actinomycetospora callitridis]
MTTPPGAPAPATPDTAATTGWHVDIPLIGPVGWPPTGNLAFLAAIGGLAALEVVAWPVAAALAVGHVLAQAHDHPVLRAVGEGLEDA